MRFGRLARPAEIASLAQAPHTPYTLTDLFTASSDKSICGLDQNGAVAWQQEGAHKYGADRRVTVDNWPLHTPCPPLHRAPINAMSLFAGHILATGDDNGVVKVWDVRSRKVAYKLRHHADVITSFTPVLAKQSLLVTAGDGTLSVVDLRNGSVVGRSDQLEEELTCGAVVKGGKKFLAGTTDGVLATYTWGKWEDLSDRYPGHPGSVNCLLPLTEDVVLAGTDDGNLRAISVQPNAVLALVGQHEDGGVERIALSRGGDLVASTAHGESVQFWDISGIRAGIASGALQAAAAAAKTSARGTGTVLGAEAATPVWRDEDEELSSDSDGDTDLRGAALGGGSAKLAARGAGGFFADL